MQEVQLIAQPAYGPGRTCGLHTWRNPTTTSVDSDLTSAPAPLILPHFALPLAPTPSPRLNCPFGPSSLSLALSLSLSLPSASMASVLRRALATSAAPPQRVLITGALGQLGTGLTRLLRYDRT